MCTWAERVIGSILVDDEDGDRSFAFDMKVPVERPIAAGLPAPPIRERQAEDRGTRQEDRFSRTEIMGDDFLGIISADDPKGRTFTLQMAILDFDLEDF